MDRISENGQHFWYLAFARKWTEPVDFVPEIYGVNPVEPMAPSRHGRAINRDYRERAPEYRGPGFSKKGIPTAETVQIEDPLLGRNIDTYA